MKHTAIHFLRIWSPYTHRISFKYYFKSQIVIGSDKTADLTLQNLVGFFARLNFSEKTLNFLDHPEAQAVEEGKLFQLGEYALQWRQIRFLQPNRKAMGSAALAIIGLLLMALLTTGFVGFDRCKGVQRALGRGDWSKRFLADLPERDQKRFEVAKSLRAEFQKAITGKDFVKARSVLNELKRNFDSENIDLSCGLSDWIGSLETALSHALIKDYLKANEVIKAAEEYSRIRHSRPSGGIESRLIRAARDLYFEGYRLEDDESDEAYLKMDQAREVCRILNLDADCFRGTKKTRLRPGRDLKEEGHESTP